MSIGIPINNTSSLELKSTGTLLLNCSENPNSKFTQDLKKKVGPNKYKNNKRVSAKKGKRSMKKEKKRNSETKKMDPGNPRKISRFIRAAKNNFGHKKLRPPNSVISLVLNLLAMASTSKKELVESKACAINIQKLASIRFDCPLTTHIVNQCISTTVE
jgi:hypothetical protein